MMRARFSRDVTVGLLVACVAGAPRALRAQRPACGTDRESQMQVVAVARDMLADTNARNVRLLDSLLLSTTPADSVTLVTDPRVCARAAQRMNWLAGEHRHDRAVYVVRLGLIWGVHDPTFHAGEYSPLVLFDRHWKLLKILLAM